MKLNPTGGNYHPLFNSGGEVSNKLPKSITDNLGQSAENIVETNKEEIARRNKKISELQEQLETTSAEHMREGVNQTITEEQDVTA